MRSFRADTRILEEFVDRCNLIGVSAERYVEALMVMALGLTPDQKDRILGWARQLIDQNLPLPANKLAIREPYSIPSEVTPQGDEHANQVAQQARDEMAKAPKKKTRGESAG